ncbi:hypothetical protein ABT168_22635 [Streptomyces sp. NPDC001793]|uniref:hypothetical protein n=1 Tax=Streptomyces sp. NPDC001793 TaxID=3154657 RepID=UPI003325F758
MPRDLAEGQRERWGPVAVAGICALLTVFDMSGVTVAVPDIATGFAVPESVVSAPLQSATLTGNRRGPGAVRRRAAPAAATARRGGQRDDHRESAPLSWAHGSSPPPL